MKRFTLLIVSVMVLSSLFAAPAKEDGLKLFVDDSFTNESFSKNISLRRTLDDVEWVIEEKWDEITEIPEDWTVIDGDGDGYEWTVGFMDGFAAHSGEQYAASFYNADGNDDWLITPMISVEDSYIFEIWYVSYNPSYLENFEILLSTTGTDPEDFVYELYTESDVPTDWQNQVISLADYAGMDVYIAIHHISVDEHYFFVDDIRIGVLSGTDIALEDNGFIYYVNPDSGYVPSIVVKNNGSTDDDFDVTCNIYHGDELVYTEIVTVSGLEYGQTDTLLFPTYMAEGEMVYDVEFSVSVEGDENPENDMATNIFTTYNTINRDIFIQNVIAVGAELSDYTVEGLNRLCDSLDGVIYVNYHLNLPDYFGEDPYGADVTWDLISLYGIGYIPITFFDGSYSLSGGTPESNFGYDYYRVRADLVASMFSPFDLDIEITSVEGNTLEITTDVEQIGELIESHDYSLRYTIFENKISYRWGEDQPHNYVYNVARTGIYDSLGLEITGPVTDVVLYETDEMWSNNNLYVVAYIQNNTTLEIYNAKVVKAYPNPDNDIEVRGNYDVEAFLPLAPYVPDVTVYNVGLNPETFDVVYVVEEGDEVAYSGSETVTDLAPGASIDVVFDGVLLSGDKLYTIRYEVNIDDDPTPANNTFEEQVTTYFSMTRSVFVQQFTSTYCSFCPAAAVAIKSFADGMGSNVPVIAAYHSTDYFGDDPYYLESCIDVAELYGVTSYPQVWFGGVTKQEGAPDNLASLYRDKYTAAAEQFVPYGVDVKLTTLAPAFFSITADITQVAKIPEGADVKLKYVIIEKEVDHVWGSASELSQLHYVVRGFISGTYGVSVSNTVGTSSNTQVTFLTSFLRDNIDNVYVIAFIQNNTNGEIYCCDQVRIHPSSLEAVEENKISQPDVFSLSCSPNPFNAATEISYNVPDNGEYTLNVYNINGQHIKTLGNGFADAGNHSAIWNGTDENGKTVTSGLYIVNFRQGNNKTSQVISLIK